MSGVQECNIPNLFMGQLPHRIVLGMVKSSDYNGNRSSNPFKFQHFNVNHLSITVNGRQVPNHPYEPDFTTKSVRRSYHHLMETVLGNCQDERSIGLSMDDYLNGGKTFFGFTVFGDSAGGGTSSVYSRKTGNINLRLRFSSVLSQNITIIIYAEFQNQIEIDASRQVHVDFN